jgi:hypothetical protein
MAHCQRAKLLVSAEEKGIGADHQRACPQAGCGCKGRIEIALGAGIQEMELQP